MSKDRAPPLLQDVIIDGDALRRQGHWLPLRDIPADAPEQPGWSEDLPEDVRQRAERILPRVRKRAVDAAIRAARQRLDAPPGDDDPEQR